MNVSPYLNFPGNCREAFQSYEKLFGAKIEMMQTHGESPMENQPWGEGWKDKILHVMMKVGDTILMASDAPPDYYHQPQGFYVSLSMENPDDADRIYKALVEGGSIQMPIQQTFWAKRFAMLTDRYGIPWMINCQ